MATMNVPEVARDLIIRALDALSDRMATSEAEILTPVQRLAGSWRSLSTQDRDEVAGYIGAAAGGLVAALPVAVRATRKTVRRRRARKAVAKSVTPVATVVTPEASDKKDDKDKKNKKKKDKKDKKDKKRKKDKKKKKK